MVKYHMYLIKTEYGNNSLGYLCWLFPDKLENSNHLIQMFVWSSWYGVWLSIVYGMAHFAEIQLFSIKQKRLDTTCSQRNFLCNFCCCKDRWKVETRSRGSRGKSIRVAFGRFFFYWFVLQVVRNWIISKYISTCISNSFNRSIITTLDVYN